MSQVPVVRGSCGGRSFGARRWCLEGLWIGMRGVYGLLSTLVHICVIYGMVMDETQHEFPGGGVGELLFVRQQEAFAVRH